MHLFVRLSLATALITVLACGSSPTAPDLAVAPAPALTADTASGVNTAALEARGRVRESCGIAAIFVSVVPGTPDDRASYTLEAAYKGDATGCPDLVWSVFPPAPMVVNPKQPELVTVYDNPENKLGRVDVTATLGSLRVSGTERIQFPRSSR